LNGVPPPLRSPRALTEITRSRSESGRIVSMFSVPDRPWPTRLASGVLNTLSALVSSDGYWSNSTLRLLPVETCSRPLSSVLAKSPDRPRMLISVARPPTRCAARPGRRAIDSAMLLSGSLPMSSAEIASTMLSLFFLTLMALSMPRRMPVTVTTSPPAGAALVCAPAVPGTADKAAAISAAAAATGVACRGARSARRRVFAYFIALSPRSRGGSTTAHSGPKVCTKTRSLEPLRKP